MPTTHIFALLCTRLNRPTVYVRGLPTDIAALEAEIDRLVSDLYGRATWLRRNRP